MGDSITDLSSKVIHSQVLSVGTTKWRVLIVDMDSVKIIGSACKMYDLTEENIIVVENINLRRQPIPQMEAIYFVSPTKEVVDLICADFEDKDEPLYAGAHIFFTSSVSEELLSIIAKARVSKFVKTLKNINFNFKVLESRLFSTEQPDAAYALYSPQKTKSDLELLTQTVVSKLLSVCSLCGYRPYLWRSSTDGPAARIAAVLNAEFDRINFDKPLLRDPECQLLLLDRSFDPITPLLADFTFQAMINDLLPVTNFNSIKIAIDPEKGEEEHLFSDDDTFWTSLRHKHIADVTQIIVDRFKEFTSSNKACAMKIKGHSITSRADLSATIRAIPEYKELVQKVSFFNALTENCMKIYNERKLQDIAQIEQNLATGFDENHEKPKDTVVQLRRVMENTTIRRADKLCVLMLYIITKGGLKEKELRQFCEEFSLSTTERLSVLNLLYLGVSVTNLGRSSKEKEKEKKKKKKKTDDEDVPYVLSRYVPKLKDILERFISHEVDSDFVAVGDSIPTEKKPKERKKKITLKSASTRTNTKGEDVSSSSTPPFFVFIAGGMTFSEIKTIYQVSSKKSKNIFGGSTHFLTPDLFCKDLLSLKPVSQV